MSSFNKYPHVFSPIKIGNMEVKNRIQFSPMVSSLSTPTGGVSPELLGYIKYQAQSGVGVITIGSTPIDHINGVDFFGALDVTSDDNMTDLRRISEVVHRYGAKVSCELVHAGRSAPKQFRPNSPAIAPSAIPVENGPTDIREMDEKDMETIRNEYCDVAERLMKSGFDMVMVHAAHGNLLAQFMSPKYNQRTDEYGGSFENRVRWPISVLKAMCERVGRGLCIDMRISGDELVPGGMGIEETKAFIRLAQEYIDTVHVSQGLIVEPKYMPYTMPAFYLPHCHNVKWSEQVKADPEIHIPVTVVGSITTIAEAEEIIASGKADMVAMARQLMCDNKLLYNAYHGMEEKTRPCLRCHECAPADIVHLRCATNPRLGRESEIPEELPYAKHKKRVVVVGGGVAGCMAAKTLVERGHDVTLIEKGDKLGGRLHEISCLSFKFDMRRHLQWLMSSTMECGAKIMLNTEATPEIIMGLKPDVVFVATGAERLSLPIPGIDRENVHHVLDVDTGRAAVGERVVVCGGGLIFNPFEKKLHEYVLCCGFIALVIGFMIIYFAQSLVVLFIGAFIVGTSIGFEMPGTLLYATNYNTVEASTAGCAIIHMAGQLGTVCSALFYTPVAGLIKPNDTSFRFLFAACVCTALALLVALAVSITKKKRAA